MGTRAPSAAAHLVPSPPDSLADPSLNAYAILLDLRQIVQDINGCVHQCFSHKESLAPVSWHAYAKNVASTDNYQKILNCGYFNGLDGIDSVQSGSKWSSPSPHTATCDMPPPEEKLDALKRNLGNLRNEYDEMCGSGAVTSSDVLVSSIENNFIAARSVLDLLWGYREGIYMQSHALQMPTDLRHTRLKMHTDTGSDELSLDSTNDHSRHACQSPPLPFTTPTNTPPPSKLGMAGSGVLPWDLNPVDMDNIPPQTAASASKGRERIKKRPDANIRDGKADERGKDDKGEDLKESMVDLAQLMKKQAYTFKDILKGELQALQHANAFQTTNLDHVMGAHDKAKQHAQSAQLSLLSTALLVALVAFTFLCMIVFIFTIPY